MREIVSTLQSLRSPALQLPLPREPPGATSSPRVLRADRSQRAVAARPPAANSVRGRRKVSEDLRHRLTHVLVDVPGLGIGLDLLGADAPPDHAALRDVDHVDDER